MRIFAIDRRRLLAAPLPMPDGEVLDPVDAVAVFDRLGLPDGFPFVLDDDGRADGCRHLNRYLLDAWEQRAFDLDSMRRFHIYNLAKFLRFLRHSRAAEHARADGISTHQWLELHGEPKVDLTDASRRDLLDYRDRRRLLVEASTLKTELANLSSFYYYATKTGWIPADPVPRWGRNERNTLLPRAQPPRRAKFLSERQARHFLESGLRGDGSAELPAFPERDYAFGLVLVTTGLRREEAALLLDCEIPPPDQLSAQGVTSFLRTGKKEVTRTIYVTTELARGLDLYRRIERSALIQAAQPRLRRLRREARLLVVDDLKMTQGQPLVVVDGHRVPAHRLSNKDRAVAVRIRDDGGIEPLALFLARGGLPPAVRYWNELFSDARDRVDALGAPDRPPAHLTVSPHTLRHTFAVRMLAALMREAVDRAHDPYAFISNPVITVQQLLGHASDETTREYLYAAELWHEELPTSLRVAARLAAGTAGGTGGRE